MILWSFLWSGKDLFPWVQQDRPKCVCHLEYPVEALLSHSFWLGSPWRCRSSVTCCFSPCLHLQQQQILLIEARIIGFPKARTHTRCQQPCISSEALQKPSACSHVALELIVTLRDKEILFITHLSSGFLRKMPSKLGTDLKSYCWNQLKRFWAIAAEEIGGGRQRE